MKKKSVVSVNKTSREMLELSRKMRAAGKSIALVPTMGALHEGHVSLIKRARQQCDFLVVSIFVNPTQFAAGEDFEIYPRDLQGDLDICAAEGVDAVFAPEVEEMFRSEAATMVEPGQLGQLLEGMSRPSHFRGVCTVVAKLLNVIDPDNVYFGQKDAQQVAVLRQMLRDLDFAAQIVVCPIVREADGLAMSSRNQNLSSQQRGAALSLHRALETADRLVELGETRAAEVAAAMAEEVVIDPLCELDYTAVVDPETFEDLLEIDGRALALLAVRIGNVRLIDNKLLGATYDEYQED